jgi:phage shock protein C
MEIVDDPGSNPGRDNIFTVFTNSTLSVFCKHTINIYYIIQSIMEKRDKKKESQKTNDLYNKELFKERFSDFKDDVHSAGKRLNERAKTKDLTYDNWFYRTFGVIGPLFSSIFGLLILVFFVWILEHAAFLSGFSILLALHDFMYSNLQALFLVLLFFSYTSYFSRHHHKSYFLFSPISAAVGITVFLWIIAGSIEATSFYKNIGFLNSVSMFINNSLYWLFAFFVFVGYIVIILKILLIGLVEAAGTRNDIQKTEPRNRAGYSRNSSSGFKGKKLYRSSQDKILGGVCAGIGDYLGIDPVLIRILWIVGTIAWWPGFFAYFIAWIIIPRNPRHDW